jgi:hypothetical protein
LYDENGLYYKIIKENENALDEFQNFTINGTDLEGVLP